MRNGSTSNGNRTESNRYNQNNQNTRYRNFSRMGRKNNFKGTTNIQNSQANRENHINNQNTDMQLNRYRDNEVQGSSDRRVRFAETQHSYMTIETGIMDIHPKEKDPNPIVKILSLTMISINCTTALFELIGDSGTFAIDRRH